MCDILFIPVDLILLRYADVPKLAGIILMQIVFMLLQNMCVFCIYGGNSRCVRNGSVTGREISPTFAATLLPLLIKYA